MVTFVTITAKSKHKPGRADNAALRDELALVGSAGGTVRLPLGGFPGPRVNLLLIRHN